MSVDFLAPDRRRAFQGALPSLRSPIEWTHREQGARFEDRAGWRIVVGYGSRERELAACRESVGVADFSHLGKLELQAEPATVSSIVGELTGGAAAVEAGMATVHNESWWCPMTMGRILVLTPPEETEKVRDRLEAAAGEARFASVVEMTAGYGANAVVGPLARETFARASALDMRRDHFPNRAFAPVSVARTPGMVLHQYGDHFLHLFGAGFARYIWTVFVDAAEHLGGRAVGADTVDVLQASARVGLHA